MGYPAIIMWSVFIFHIDIYLILNSVPPYPHRFSLSYIYNQYFPLAVTSNFFHQFLQLPLAITNKCRLICKNQVPHLPFTPTFLNTPSISILRNHKYITRPCCDTKIYIIVYDIYLELYIDVYS